MASLRRCLELLPWLLGCSPAKAVSSREASSERSRLAAVSAALGCVLGGQRARLDADRYVLIYRSTCLVELLVLSHACAVLQQARPAPSARPPLATVRGRGLVGRFWLSCSLRAAVSLSSEDAFRFSLFSKCSRSSLANLFIRSLIMPSTLADCSSVSFIIVVTTSTSLRSPGTVNAFCLRLKILCCIADLFSYSSCQWCRTPQRPAWLSYPSTL